MIVASIEKNIETNNIRAATLVTADEFATRKKTIEISVAPNDANCRMQQKNNKQTVQNANQDVLTRTDADSLNQLINCMKHRHEHQQTAFFLANHLFLHLLSPPQKYATVWYRAQAQNV